jgi:hypothetical protein
MLPRLVIALAGAIAVTLAMLWGMNAVTNLFRERDATRYFRVTDFIPAPDGPRKPALPRTPEQAPESPGLEYERRGGPDVGVDRPAIGPPILEPGMPPELGPAPEGLAPRGNRPGASRNGGAEPRAGEPRPGQ